MDYLLCVRLVQAHDTHTLTGGAGGRGGDRLLEEKVIMGRGMLHGRDWGRLERRLRL